MGQVNPFDIKAIRRKIKQKWDIFALLVEGHLFSRQISGRNTGPEIS